MQGSWRIKTVIPSPITLWGNTRMSSRPLLAFPSRRTHQNVLQRTKEGKGGRKKNSSEIKSVRRGLCTHAHPCTQAVHTHTHTQTHTHTHTRTHTCTHNRCRVNSSRKEEEEEMATFVLSFPLFRCCLFFHPWRYLCSQERHISCVPPRKRGESQRGAPQKKVGIETWFHLENHYTRITIFMR